MSRSEERRVGKECIYQCDWSSGVCSSDLRRLALVTQLVCQLEAVDWPSACHGPGAGEVLSEYVVPVGGKSGVLPDDVAAPLAVRRNRAEGILSESLVAGRRAYWNTSWPPQPCCQAVNGLREDVD